MSDDPRRHRRLADPVPPMYCPARETARGSHEWRPLREEDFYCSGCLARLEAAHAEKWQQLVRGAHVVEPATLVSLELAERAAEALTLTQLERRVLVRLVSEPHAVITYPELGECVWGRSGADESDRSALRQHVARLRQKLTCLRAGISTVASVGYRFKFLSAGESEGS